MSFDHNPHPSDEESSPSAPIAPVRRLLSRMDILSVDDTRYEEVEVKEWGGWVRVRGMSGEERDALEQSTIAGRGKNMHANYENFRAKLVATAVVDEEGRRIFSDADIAILGKRSARCLQMVYDAASRLSGVTEDDAEELTKNSSRGQSGVSTSA